LYGYNGCWFSYPFFFFFRFGIVPYRSLVLVSFGILVEHEKYTVDYAGHRNFWFCTPCRESDVHVAAAAGTCSGSVSPPTTALLQQSSRAQTGVRGWPTGGVVRSGGVLTAWLCFLFSDKAPCYPSIRSI